MGTLVVRRYPTKLFLKAADHTYVECGTGARAWSCWGGKTGGTVLREAPGSTTRADCIAQRDEKAGIRCYLVNGVCHQCANRILLPAGISVQGARGYTVSYGIYGEFGRVGVWPCRSPFETCDGVSGDLGECLPPDAALRLLESTPRSLADKLDWNYTREVLAIYRAYADLFEIREAPNEQLRGSYGVSENRVREFHLALFEHMLEFHLGPMLDRDLRARLLEVRRAIESQQFELERAFALADITGRNFASRYNELTIKFQQAMGEQMTAAQYETLFGLRKDELIVLADPEVVDTVYRE